MSFDGFVAIDWSGGRPARSPSLKLAVCAPGAAAPRLVFPRAGALWSRETLLDWLHEAARGQRLLVGIDSSFALPFIDLGSYFPGLEGAPEEARSLWRRVEALSGAAPHLYAGPFADHPDVAPYFFRGRNAGARHSRRYRLTEHLCRELGLGAAQTAYHLVGPNQVGLASLSSMRALLRLDRSAFAVWPFDAEVQARSVIVEIYTALFIGAAGQGQRKIRDTRTLNAALAAFGSEPYRARGPLDDHATDVLVSAAGLRRMAGGPALWRPPALSDRVRRTEGWVFGVP